MGPGPANHLQVLLERASGPLADPYRTGLGRPLGSPASNSLETPCSVPSEGNMALPPLPPCGKATKGRTIKVETVLAEARGLLEREMCPWAISKYFGDQVPSQMV
jgi:hypothetical protein